MHVQTQAHSPINTQAYRKGPSSLSSSFLNKDITNSKQPKTRNASHPMNEASGTY